MANLTGEHLKKIRADLDQLLADYGEKIGMNFELGNIKYTDATFTIKLEGTVVDQNENGEIIEPETKMVREFKQFANVFGLSAKDLGKKVKSGGKFFTVVGLKPNYRKYPLIMAGPQGGRYKFAIDENIRKQLGH